jgi:hypothetical protein
LEALRAYLSAYLLATRSVSRFGAGAGAALAA